MKNKFLLEQFMEENGLQYNVPFWVEEGNWRVKVKIIKEHDTSRGVNMPKIKCYYNKEWGDIDSDKWLIDIVFNENYKITPPKQRLKDGEEYWYITPNGNIYSVLYDSQDTSDITFFLMGNCFKTKQEAEQNKEKILKLLRRNEPLVDLNEEVY